MHSDIMLLVPFYIIKNDILMKWHNFIISSSSFTVYNIVTNLQFNYHLPMLPCYVAQLVRAVHWYYRARSGFESHKAWTFQQLSFPNCINKLCLQFCLSLLHLILIKILNCLCTDFCQSFGKLTLSINDFSWFFSKTPRHAIQGSLTSSW